jgi:hypothetical protein
MSENCENCRFFRLDEANPKWSDCRRYPPVVYPKGDAEDIQSFCAHASTTSDQWCGEYKKNLDAYSYENAEAPVNEYLKRKV